MSASLAVFVSGREEAQISMLQPLQLQDVSNQYAGEIADLRDFFAKAGLRLGTSHTLRDVATRLREDRAFRRDLTSHAWVILHAGDQQVRYADLLGMLAIAAAGGEFAAAASDRDAHELLRFLMQAKNSFSVGDPMPGPAAARESGAVSSSPELVPVEDVELRAFRRGVTPVEAEPLSFEMPEEGFDQRKIVGAAVAACLIAMLSLGLWMHHRAAAGSTTKTAAVGEAAPITTAPPVVTGSQPGTSESPTRSTRRGTSLAPYSKLAESSRDVADSRGVAAAKPAPGTPMAAVSAPASARKSAASRSSARHASAAVPTRTPKGSRTTGATSVAGVVNDSRRNVTPVWLGVPSAPPSSVTESMARQATVRPTSLGIMAANVMYSPAPPYPAAATAAHVQGEVKLEAEVDRNGNVASTRVISGPPLLSDAAADAVQHWRYRPYMYEGKPVAMNTTVVVDFQLP